MNDRFPWSEKKDTKYYLKKTGASLKNAVENDSEYHLRQAGSNLEKAVYKGVSSLIEGFGAKKPKTFMDSFGDFIDESSEIISNDWSSFKEKFSKPETKPRPISPPSFFLTRAEDITSILEFRLGAVDNLSFEARRSRACPRDPAMLHNTQAYYTEIDRTGSRGQALERRDLNCQQPLMAT